LDDPRDMAGLARVLHVVEDRAPGRRAWRLRHRRRHARREFALWLGERDHWLVLDDLLVSDPGRVLDGGLVDQGIGARGGRRGGTRLDHPAPAVAPSVYTVHVSIINRHVSQPARSPSASLIATHSYSSRIQ